MMGSNREVWDTEEREEEAQKTDVTMKLIPKVDKNGHTYHIARTDAPLLLDLRECTFFVFTGENPEISIRRTRLSSGQKKRVRSSS